MTDRDPSSATNVGSKAQDNPDHSTVGENAAGQATNVKAPDFIPQGKVVGTNKSNTNDQQSDAKDSIRDSQ